MATFDEMKTLDGFDSVHIKMMVASLMAENNEMRKELDRVVLERNKFLEKLLEIQLPRPIPKEQIRLTESVPEKKFVVHNRETAMQIEDADRMKHLDDLKSPM